MNIQVYWDGNEMKIEELSAAIAQLSALYSQVMAMSTMEEPNECEGQYA